MQLHFKTYCNKKNLQSVRDFLRKSLTENGITDPDAYMTVLAVDEICANLMIFHNQLKIIISDTGTTFNYENHIDNTLVSLIDEKRKGGLGLMLVKKIMDEVSYESVRGRNSWVLSKKIG